MNLKSLPHHEGNNWLDQRVVYAIMCFNQMHAKHSASIIEQCKGKKSNILTWLLSIAPATAAIIKMDNCHCF